MIAASDQRSMVRHHCGRIGSPGFAGAAPKTMSVIGNCPFPSACLVPPGFSRCGSYFARTLAEIAGDYASARASSVTSILQPRWASPGASSTRRIIRAAPARPSGRRSPHPRPEATAQRVRSPRAARHRPPATGWRDRPPPRPPRPRLAVARPGGEEEGAARHEMAGEDREHRRADPHGSGERSCPRRRCRRTAARGRARACRPAPIPPPETAPARWPASPPRNPPRSRDARVRSGSPRSARRRRSPRSSTAASSGASARKRSSQRTSTSRRLRVRSKPSACAS